MKKVVISLGGSLICPDKADINFLKSFKALILQNPGCQYFIVCGGGKLARDYQEAASRISDLEDVDKDWIGIEATKMNAFLVKSIFSKKLVHNNVISNPSITTNYKENIVVFSGWKPGWSTDYDSVLIAQNQKADMIINMSNIDYVYDSDPRKNKDAKPRKSLSWKELRKLVGDKWSPGLNMPFDPIAAKEAEKLGLNTVIIGGDLDNLKKVLKGEDFKGTTIN